MCGHTYTHDGYFFCGGGFFPNITKVLTKTVFGGGDFSEFYHKYNTMTVENLPSLTSLYKKITPKILTSKKCDKKCLIFFSHMSTEISMCLYINVGKFSTVIVLYL